MNVAIIGTGYVGLTTGVCLAELGNTVTCIDVDEKKIEQLSRGECPIYEEGLRELLQKNVNADRIHFTNSCTDGALNADVVYFAVQTPEGSYGKADLSILLAAASGCASIVRNGVLFVNKSTAPVGTVARLRDAIQSACPTLSFLIASNPEFLSEGNAVKNFMEPDRIVIGTEDDAAKNILEELYRPLTQRGHPLIATTIQSAELIKYTANAFLALKISFMNEIADFAELVGADVQEVARGIGADTRIGSSFLRAGIGYGGSCFGKDVKALAKSGEEYGYEFKIIKALSTVNDLRYQIILRKLQRHIPTITGTRIAILGLAYKPKTDDVRDAPSHRITHELIEKGAHLSVYDPIAQDSFRKHFVRSDEITFSSSVNDAAQHADVLIFLTEWKEFTTLPLATLCGSMRGNLLIDGRNIFERKIVEDSGFIYEAIGR